MQENIFNRINVDIKRAYYMHERYKVVSTFTLIYFEKTITPEELAKYVRASDKFVLFDENYCFMNYVLSSEEEAYKASQNLLLYLDNHFNSRTTCVAVDNFNPSKTPQIVLNRLNQILKETRENSYARIEDEEILNGVV